jgi:hypothetical protein
MLLQANPDSSTTREEYWVSRMWTYCLKKAPCARASDGPVSFFLTERAFRI